MIAEKSDIKDSFDFTLKNEHKETLFFMQCTMRT